MTIFHVLKYPIPNWNDVLSELVVPEIIREQFFHEAGELGTRWLADGGIYIEELNIEYSKLYVRLLSEYEES